ncbi:MAG: hypothetical protein KDA80_06765, partial [Planctomycetaceae bacterium]|nr:hypothetical protein [Planctomycetaceae bacterium]
AADVHQLLGTAADDRLVQLVDAMIAGNPAQGVQFVEECLSEGVQIGSFSDQLLAYLRDLLITAAGANDVSLSAVSDSSREDVERQAKTWGLQNVSAAMQILADTKNKMQRVNYGRALIELAIVRMATLEDLTEISALAQRMAAGGSSPQAGGRPLPNAQPALKKNAEVKPETPSAEVAPDALPTPPAQQESLPLSEDTVEEIWARISRSVPDKTVDHLKNATCANSGPNILEVVFPKSYSFSKRYCERPELLSRLNSLVEEICGPQVRLVLKLDETAPAMKPPSTKSPERPEIQRRRTSVVDNDQFVQNAVQIFGGQVVEVRPILAPAVVESVEDHEELAEDED